MNSTSPSINPNLLVKAAKSLLVLKVAIQKKDRYPNDVDELRAQCLEEVKNFEIYANRANYDSHTVLAAQYCLCTAIDEAVLTTSWGSQSSWAQHSLLATVHHETFGGERFYLILKKMIDKPKKNRDLLELLYLILSLGFQGKYHGHKEAHQKIRADLFSILHPDHSPTSTAFLPSIPTHLSSHQRSRYFLPFEILVPTTCMVLFLMFKLVHFYSQTVSEPVFSSLQQIGN